MKKILALAAMLLAASLAYAQLGGTPPYNTSLTVTVGPEAALTINNATTNLTSTGTNFSSYSGTTGFTYFIRTTQTGGTGSIQLQITSDFSPANGPSVASPPTSTDKLAYNSTVSTPGTAASAGQTASTSATTPVATFGANARSAYAGNSGSVVWALTNDPLYYTGSYAATATFTISAA
jgi:hypothetical protein